VWPLRRTAQIATVAAALGGCGEPEEQALVRRATVVYEGWSRHTVDRLEENVARSVQRSAVVLVHSEVLRRDCDEVPKVHESWGICPDHPQAFETSAAQCSGILIARDVVLTAAHCFTHTDCSAYSTILWHSDSRFVDRPSTCPSPADAVDCEEVLWRDAEADILAFRTNAPLGAPIQFGPDPTPGQQLIACGASLGAALRCDPSAVVTSRGGRIRADIAAGASGGPILHEDGRLGGLLVGGQVDVEDFSGCNREIVHSEGDLASQSAEVFIPASRLLSPASPSPSNCSFGMQRSVPGSRPAFWILAMPAFFLLRRTTRTGSPGTKLVTRYFPEGPGSTPPLAATSARASSIESGGSRR
jgi:hypothetical protein